MRSLAATMGQMGVGSDLVALPSGSSYLLYDTFIGTNGTALTSHTMNVGPGWTVFSGTGTPEIESNSMAATATNDNAVYSDAGQANVQMTVTFNYVTNTWPVLLGRIQNTSNYINCYYSDLTKLWYVTEIVSGTVNQRAAAAGAVLVTGTSYTLSLIYSGSSLSFYCNGSLQVSYSSLSLTTGTKFGPDLFGYLAAPSGTYNNFQVTPHS